ncbi:hypothetical protein CSKR_105545 [Clonorchis sinensis]|uniref:Uncharacterized protein n=1 Tax=Clonorchis sinensis TaxID=79923 RepID=A0A419QEQ2_CLOSI|nr:hypothetical protein CSKR_105545 [Clonorchis sinensis]
MEEKSQENEKLMILQTLEKCPKQCHTIQMSARLTLGLFVGDQCPRAKPSAQKPDRKTASSHIFQHPTWRASRLVRYLTTDLPGMKKFRSVARAPPKDQKTRAVTPPQLNVLHQAASCSSCYDIRDIAIHNIRLTETRGLRLPDESQEGRNRSWAVEQFSATL